MMEEALSLSHDYWNRASQRANLFLHAEKVRVRFTRDGLRQLSRLHRLPGSTFLRAVTIRAALALYIAAHESKNIHFDTDGQEVTYQNGISLVLRKEQDVWFVTDVIGGEEGVGYAPVFVWTQFKRGCSFILAQILVGWQKLKKRVQNDMYGGGEKI